MISQALQLAKKTIPDRHKLFLKARRRRGHWFLKTEDRRLLEREIIPHFADLERIGRVLDIGCDWYTSGYPTLFERQRYCSIDIDPEKARFAKGEHRTGSLLELDAHFGAASFDLVIANGVFGWGVNGRGQIARAMAQIERVLGRRGCVVLGWNDVPERRPEPLEEMLAAPGFEPLPIPRIGSNTVDTGTAYRHRYHFLRKLG